MTKTLVVLGAVLVLTASVCPHGQIALAQQEEPEKLLEPFGGRPAEEVKKMPVVRATKRAAAEVGDHVSEWAQYGVPWLAFLGNRDYIGWPIAVLMLVGGPVLLLFGWSLLRNTFVPFATLLGCVAGAFMGLRALLSITPQASEAAKLTSLLVGAAAGALLYLLIAIKARPFACMLTVMTPFLVLSTLMLPLGSTGTTVAVVTLAVGVVLGFGSMWHLRPLAVGSTSLMGALFLLTCWGITTYLLDINFMHRSLAFLLERPWLLVGITAFLMALGVNFQVTVGPPDMEPHKLKGLADKLR